MDMMPMVRLITTATPCLREPLVDQKHLRLHPTNHDYDEYEPGRPAARQSWEPIP